jgi:hypothetical protein
MSNEVLALWLEHYDLMIVGYQLHEVEAELFEAEGYTQKSMIQMARAKGLRQYLGAHIDIND